MTRYAALGLTLILLTATAVGCASSGNTTASTTTSTAARASHEQPKPRRATFGGLGGAERVFTAANYQGPANLAGAPAGLAWYTVDATNAAGRVVAFHVTENAKPPMGDEERLALVAGTMLPGPAEVPLHQTPTCAVYRDPALKALVGMEYAAATTTTGTTTAYMRAESSPTCQ